MGTTSVSGGSRRDLKDELNRATPGARDARLGDVIDDLITQHNALLAALDTANVAGGTNVQNFSVTPLSQRIR